MQNQKSKAKTHCQEISHILLTEKFLMLFRCVLNTALLFCVGKVRVFHNQLQKTFLYSEHKFACYSLDISYSLELLTYFCIYYSLAIFFSAIGFIITHPIVDIWQNFEYVLWVKQKENICAWGNVITSKSLHRY